MLELNLTIDSKDFRNWSKKVIENVGDMRPVFVLATAIIAKSVARRFRAAGESPFNWAALSPSWIKQRQKEGTWPGGHALAQPILNRYGTLFQAVTTFSTRGGYRRTTRRFMELGTTLVKARGLQGGLPARSGIASIPQHTRTLSDGRTVTVKAHQRAFSFGPVPARPFLYFSAKDTQQIMAITHAFAFQPNVAQRFSTAPTLSSIPGNLFKGFG